MLGFDPIQVFVTAEQTSDGNYKVSVKHEEITSERVLDKPTFARFREALGGTNPSVGTPELAGQPFTGPVSRRVLEDFGFAEFYRAA
jgi:hypothetical protein